MIRILNPLKDEKMKSYAIVGTGAIGGYCAVKLQQAGFDVHCLLSRDYAYVKEHGLTVVSADTGTTQTVFVNAYQVAVQMPQCDVILVALKATANSILPDLLPKLLHNDSVVVILQNGIGIEQEIAQFIPAHKIIAGSTILKVSKDAPGIITHFGFNNFELAQFYPEVDRAGITQSVEILVQNFIKAGINTTAATHLPTVKWKKLASNIPVSGLSVVLNASLSELANNPASFELLKTITKEIISTATQCGAHMPDDFYQFRLNIFESFKAMPNSYPSMKVDFDAKRPLELHAIYENAIRWAQGHKVSMPLTQMLYQQLLYLCTSQ